MTIMGMLTLIFLLAATIHSVVSQSYTFPLSPNQPYPQYNNAYDSRYSYLSNQPMQLQNVYPNQIRQMNGLPNMSQMSKFDQIQMSNPMDSPFQKRLTFNPMARIQVQAPIAQESSFSSSRATSPLGASDYQVDHRVPLPSASDLQSHSSKPTRIIPPFLESASVADQNKFYDIVQHPMWSGAEKNRRIEEFMKTMSDERQSMYTNYRRDIVDKEVEEKRQNVNRVVNTMSKEAVEEFHKVVQIMHDPTHEESEKLKKIEEIYSKLPDSIRKEFDVKLKGF